MSKIKNLFCKPFPRPVTIITLGIAAVLAAIPLMAFLVLIIDWFEPVFSFLLEYLPPVMLFYTLLIVLPASYSVLLLQNYFSKTKSPVKLLKRILINTLIGLSIYFWYKAWWGDYLFRDFLGNFGNLPLRDQLNILQSYALALSKTAAVTCLAIVAWLYLKSTQKHNS